ncbi:MAG: DUF1345 domain-containing protein, partial [Microbacteriaceae bacterium]
ALASLSIILSWILLHTLYMLRYASLYFEGEPGGINFNMKEPPVYRDFAYLAFVIGMTYQVSDTNLESTKMRSTALVHSLLAFLFGMVFLATLINLVIN